VTATKQYEQELSKRIRKKQTSREDRAELRPVFAQTTLRRVVQRYKKLSKKTVVEGGAPSRVK